MIRFKVVRASRLLIGFAIALLVIVLAVLIFRLATASSAEPTTTRQGSSSIVTTDGTQEAVAAFAAASSLSVNDGSGNGSGGLHEDEHTDSVVPGMTIEKIPFDAPPGGSALPLTPDAAAPDAAASRNTPDAGKRPRVLIYHTHTNEAYDQDPADPYTQTEPWRTTDHRHSIVRVGDELAALLSAKGFEVVHDVTDHEPPKLGTAYERSLLTLEAYQGTPFDLYIDLHRDAAAEGQDGARVVLNNAGRPCAQLMMLVGKADGAEFKEKPDFEANLRFARQLTSALNTIQPGICKDVLVKTNRYNQHVGTPAILIEVGDNLNTLRQALDAMPQLGEAISRVMGGEVFPEPSPKPSALPASAQSGG